MMNLNQLTLQSVKLTGITIPDGTASIKLKYQRNGAPTESNPLEGLFDYTSTAKQLLPAAGATGQTPVGFNAQARQVLVREMQRQNIRCGKFKVRFKSAVAKEPLASLEMYVCRAITRSRLQGEINDTEINHGHFREDQKNNATGNSVENLQWVIKLESEK